MKIELVSVADAARLSGVHTDTLYQAIADGRLDYVECDKKKMLLAAQVEAFAPAKRGRKPSQMREGDTNATV